MDIYLHVFVAYIDYQVFIFLHFIHDFGFIKKVYDIIGVVFCWASYA